MCHVHTMYGCLSLNSLHFGLCCDAILSIQYLIYINTMFGFVHWL
uniref:Uncharacterized protein n=1 Tax=Arundo donax TaxID=35708 RepID=A0A0A9GSB8_ARUDO